jgi:hypothetical protein
MPTVAIIDAMISSASRSMNMGIISIGSTSRVRKSVWDLARHANEQNDRPKCINLLVEHLQSF